MESGAPQVGSCVFGNNSMRLHRLWYMGLRELAGRGRQEIEKWQERITGAVNSNGSPSWILTEVGRGLDLDGFNARMQNGELSGPAPWLLDQFRKRFADRFFEGSVTDELPALMAAQF